MESLPPRRGGGRTLNMLLNQLVRHDPAAYQMCVMCDNEGLHHCARCNAPYCSSKCQTDDWPLHKTICRDLAGGLASSERPGRDFRRMLLFPVDEAYPKLIWLENNFDKGTPGYMAEMSETLNAPTRLAGSLFTRALTAITINFSIAFRRCGHVLRLVVLVRPGVPALRLNNSITKLSPPGTPCSIWEIRGSCATEILDVNARDLRTAVDHFQFMSLNPCITNPSRFPAGFYQCQIWPAIKINCDGDIELLQAYMPRGQALPRYEHVTRTNKAGMHFCTAIFPGDPADDGDMLTVGTRFCEDIGTLVVNHARGARISLLHLRWLAAWCEENYPTDEDSQNDTGGSGPKDDDGDGYDLMDVLGDHMAKNERWVKIVNAAKQHWANFLEKNRDDPDAAKIVSPWEL
ncbi:hypothetical protein PG990_008153 [Apiospora arundinis]